MCSWCLSLAYRLYTVVPKLLTFVDNLTNWFVRFNRKRLKVQCLTTDSQTLYLGGADA